MLLVVVHQQGLKTALWVICARDAHSANSSNNAFENKKSQSKYALRFGVLLVEMMGIEPTTSTLRTLRSPN